VAAASSTVTSTSLAGPPFHLNSARIEDYSNQIVHFLNQHQSLVAGTVVTGGRIVLEVLTGLILTIFITFFLLKDGDRIWSWLISGLRPGARRRATSPTACGSIRKGTSIRPGPAACGPSPRQASIWARFSFRARPPGSRLSIFALPTPTTNPLLRCGKQ
jgi:hypothetical protein